METVHYGLIGCGMMGREHIQNINLLTNGKVSVVYDPVMELAESAATLAQEAHVAASLEDLLAFGDEIWGTDTPAETLTTLLAARA